MNNPTQPTPAPATLTQCVHLIADYLRPLDANGLEVFLGEVEGMESPVDTDTAGICYCLTQTLRTRFTVDIIENSGTSHDPLMIENLEDRENAFAVLERAEALSPVAFAGEFLRLAPYILHNVPPQE